MSALGAQRMSTRVKVEMLTDRIIVDANKTRKLLYEVLCPRCSTMIDYGLIDALDPQCAAELSLRTAIGDDSGFYN